MPMVVAMIVDIVLQSTLQREANLARGGQTGWRAVLLMRRPVGCGT